MYLRAPHRSHLAEDGYTKCYEDIIAEVARKQSVSTENCGATGPSKNYSGTQLTSLTCVHLTALYAAQANLNCPDTKLS